MPRFLIERKIPNVGQLGPEELKGVSQTSNRVLQEMREEGKNVQWMESYVTDNAIHCVYVASDADLVREHAQRGGFPADGVHAVGTTISPLTAE